MSESDDDEKYFSNTNITNNEIFKNKIKDYVNTALTGETEQINENEKIEKLLEKKLKENELKDRAKQVYKKLIKNPKKYINFLKIYIAISIISIKKNVLEAFLEDVQCSCISVLSVQEILELQKNYSFAQKIQLIQKIFTKHFNLLSYENTNNLLENLSSTKKKSFDFFQFNLLFISFCQFFEIQIRFCQIIDLRSLKLNKKHIINMELQNEKNKKNLKRKPKITKNKNKKKPRNSKGIIDKVVSNLIENDIAESYFFENESSSSEEHDTKLQFEEFFFKKNKTNNNNSPKNIENTVKSSEKLQKNEQNDYKFWLEVFDSEQALWLPIDPTSQIYPNTINIKDKLNKMPGFLIISLQEIVLQTGIKEIYIQDITAKYCENRKQLGLNDFWNNLLKLLNPNESELQNFFLEINSQEKNFFLEKQKKEIPENIVEFRHSEFYIIPSLLKKYQGLLPGSKGIGLQYKEEDIYERKCVTELHTRTKWVEYGRKVIKDEVPVKHVLAQTGDGDVSAGLFGIWQTEEYLAILNEDGSLPKNEYGNYDMFSGKIPEGTMHIDLPGLPKLCEKNNIPFVEAVVGFERGKSRKSHPKKSGVLAFEKDREQIELLWQENQEEIISKEKIKIKKELISHWKLLFKSILIKKELIEEYNKT